jgi:hypothetical protein
MYERPEDRHGEFEPVRVRGRRPERDADSAVVLAGDAEELLRLQPEPVPQLIATRDAWTALAISKGIDRDRAVDEDGNQLAVFGRRGARPFNGEEMRRMYLRAGELYTVTDERDLAFVVTTGFAA